jgi:hypothetical protein
MLLMAAVATPTIKLPTTQTIQSFTGNGMAGLI